MVCVSSVARTPRVLNDKLETVTEIGIVFISDFKRPYRVGFKVTVFQSGVGYEIEFVKLARVIVELVG